MLKFARFPNAGGVTLVVAAGGRLVASTITRSY